MVIRPAQPTGSQEAFSTGLACRPFGNRQSAGPSWPAGVQAVGVLGLMLMGCRMRAGECSCPESVPIHVS